ncbi:glycoside hydrolase family 15 protein [Motilibacter sp. E257]|uniref:Glycoside hydrolase family 15 protein n=1 Tax=Motilibacter deserti TaxID=2714956 RepID=A0ABX0GT69_9ACTN|nr:glycoside hydrolase family 15 protein [Motilibacter deserti]NHC14089.1 glycoside hydrolase family 15 protein [Motilibacter deserti]
MPAATPPGGAPTRDEDGYAPLADYAGIGDGRSVALIAKDGSVDWWAVPDLHGVPAFAALLDPREGGSISLRPDEPFTVERGYVGDTNVVATEFVTRSGRVRVTDALNTGVAGRLPWSELARRVEGVEGHVPMRWEVSPGSALGVLAPWADEHETGPLLKLDDLTMGVRCGDVGSHETHGSSVTGHFRTAPGSRGVLGVVATSREPLYLPGADQLDSRIDRTVRGWQDWSDTLVWSGSWEKAVRRAALALKLLLYAPTGAIAAAATTSVPERLDGGKNWDYRYTWVRDTAYTLDAFVRLGLHEEVHAAVSWLLATVERHGPELQPFYSLDGELPGGSRRRDVPGYRRSAPVVDGNDAAGQLQLGPYGDLFQTVFLCVQEGHVLDARTSRVLADLADRCCDDWQRRDAGMWELHDERHFTLSKMSCWQALDRAARLADGGHLPGNPRRWRMESARIREWVAEHCWSEERQAYTLHAGTEDLDAGVLLGARFGFDRGPRMASTVTAVRQELGTGPLLHRYSGMQKEEGAFLACTFWAVEALAFTDQLEQAKHLMDEVLALTDGPGLLSEMVDPRDGSLLGNLPQALSYLGLINAACAVDEVERREA